MTSPLKPPKGMKEKMEEIKQGKVPASPQPPKKQVGVSGQKDGVVTGADGEQKLVMRDRHDDEGVSWRESRAA